MKQKEVQMKVIIAGSRHITNSSVVAGAIAQWQLAYPLTEVVVGGGRGVDHLAEQWALAESMPLRRFPADWERYGRAAGPIRNRQMASYAKGLLALPAGASRGTRDMITQAHKYGLTIFVIEQPAIIAINDQP